MKSFNEYITEATWNKKKLLSLADENGVIKGFKPGTKSIKVKIWPNGKITRADVDLSVATNMSVKQVVKMLKLTDEDLLK